MATIILGDIVEVIKETVHNPQESGFQYFVGLEHYDSGEPLITRYSTPENLTSSVKHFAKGDILVARRNVYLKRASLVDFEGVTSGDSIVLRAKDKKYQHILPFILNSEDFWDYAEQNSDGTMSKRLSPADLLDYEFEEPADIDLLADKLWAAYRVKESYKKLLAATDDMLKAKFIEMFGEEEKIKIGDAFTTTSGGTPNSKITHYYSGGTIPWLTSGEVRQGYIHSTESYITEEGLANSSAKWIPESSVVIAMYGATIGNVGITNIPLTTNQAICSILPNNKYDQVFVYYAVKNKTDWMKSQSRGAAQPNISQAIIKQMEIPLPPLPLQQQFVEIANQAEATKESLRKSIENIDQVIKSLINQ